MGHWLKMAALALASAVPLIGMAQDKVDIPSRTPSTWTEYAHGQGAAVTIVGYLYLPSGVKGPVPAMILKHGSTGLTGVQSDNIRKWAKSLNDWGIAAFVVDSFGPRCIGQSASDQSKLRSLTEFRGERGRSCQPPSESQNCAIFPEIKVIAKVSRHVTSRREYAFGKV